MEYTDALNTCDDMAEGLGRLGAACNTTPADDEAQTAATELCASSLHNFKFGDYDRSLADAEAALQLLLTQELRPPALLAKAFHRKAQALIALEQLVDGVRTYKQGLEECKGSQELHAALRLVAELLPPSWLGKYWSGVVAAAQAPNPFSSRDGRLIKPVPPELRLPEEELAARLTEALRQDQLLRGEARDLLCMAWAERRRPGRAEAAFFRAAAYLQGGNAAQAVKDTQFAVVYGPQVPGSGSSGSSRPAWPAALALKAAALEAQQDNIGAALAAAMASELDPECEQYQEALARMLSRVPESCAQALRSGGAAGLEAHLEGEREAAKPEFMKQRPKYYYYYEWMKKRIREQCPLELPEPVMDKLLTLEAGELDLMLQYPTATQQTVDRLMAVYEEQGADYLDTYRLPLLSWEQVQEHKAAAEALPAPGQGSAAPKALPPACKAAGDQPAPVAQQQGLPPAPSIQQEPARRKAAVGQSAGGAAGGNFEVQHESESDAGSESADEVEIDEILEELD